MKAILAALLLLAPSRLVADGAYRSPEDVLKIDGALALTDGSSYFVFSRDGTFQSFPVPMSGRCLDGRWKVTGSRPSVFEVEAKMTWINGMSGDDDYKRIVFVVYSGDKKSNSLGCSSGHAAPKEVWGSYYLIDELTKIPKPIK